MDFCTCCNVAIDRLEISVKCNVCTRIFKPRCVDLSYSEAYKVNCNAGLSWTCSDCHKISNDTNILKRDNLFLQVELKNALARLNKQIHENQMLPYNPPGLFGGGYLARRGELPNLEHAGIVVNNIVGIRTIQVAE